MFDGNLSFKEVMKCTGVGRKVFDVDCSMGALPNHSVKMVLDSTPMYLYLTFDILARSTNR